MWADFRCMKPSALLVGDDHVFVFGILIGIEVLPLCEHEFGDDGDDDGQQDGAGDVEVPVADRCDQVVGIDVYATMTPRTGERCSTSGRSLDWSAPMGSAGLVSQCPGREVGWSGGALAGEHGPVLAGQCHGSFQVAAANGGNDLCVLFG